ncbi:D-tyrosyl-tRNA(Tyr) deacylase [Cyclobacterium lianum]|uniref:D-aminoacyl-tRNA deacylase n=1 Tax=Cyclobacterium lianum TaxID=388280 RepID=A0A1M7PMH6_9BACT|nr:D-aminoacyl-tRNA deacylase [Cyclobacterium lianum]SHN18275.1 D-tyrosyl-tRNA(Tyr) deacylase [Cyclobacterium lianum]
MIAVIQRVAKAAVSINNVEKSSIATGLLVLLGVEDVDTAEDVDWICRKLVHMRIFPDSAGVMNRSILDAGGDILLISQFTLHASTKKGNRPSYVKAANPETAIPLYESCIRELSAKLEKPVATGEFGADMQVSLINDGPVTIIIDSRNRV